MMRVTLVAFLLGVLTGVVAFSTALWGRTVFAQQIAAGVYESNFRNGTTCYTNNAGGIYCFR